MKLILLLAIVAISSSYAFLHEKHYGEKFLALTKKWHDKCVPITGVTQAQIDELKNGVFAETEAIKRYTLCLWFVSDVMNVDYTLNEKLLRELMPKKLAKGAETYLDCAKRARENIEHVPHLKVWELVRCVYNSNPEDFLMF